MYHIVLRRHDREPWPEQAKTQAVNLVADRLGDWSDRVLVIGCGTWARLAKLEGAVIATGSIKVDQNLKEIQHRDGGIVKTLSIRQGDFVKEGQVLPRSTTCRSRPSC